MGNRLSNAKVGKSFSDHDKHSGNCTADPLSGIVDTVITRKLNHLGKDSKHMNINTKFEKLKDIAKGLGRVLVAFSGGVDSTLLLKICVDTLGPENVLAVIGTSPTYPARELAEARAIAKTVMANCVVIETPEMDDPDFIRNQRDRCYYCKRSLFDLMGEIAEQAGLNHVVEGSNLDDMNDFRPGRRAVEEKGVISPLLLAKLTKSDIREISRILDLPTHNKPSYACLASRIPYGTPIDKDLLRRIEYSEDFLQDLGFKQIRVRCHGDVARIEVPVQDFGTVVAKGEKIYESLKNFGFTYITLDLKGYRTGSMNEEGPSTPH